MPIPLHILTGFLGSGKTTLLNRYLADPQFANTAVLINEFGAVALDHLLVESVDEEIVLLESGCVCCSVRDDFTSALLNLSARRDERLRFDKIVLETTGIADPNAIHQLLLGDAMLQTRFRHAGTVAVIDGVFGQRNFDRHPEAVIQAVVANGLLISKGDLASAEDIELLENRLHDLNPAALRDQRGSLTELLDRCVGEQVMTRQIDAAKIPVKLAPGQHSGRFSTFTLTHRKPVDSNDLNAWLEALLFARGDDIFRIKGWVWVKGERFPVIINSVCQALYSPTQLAKWPDRRPSTSLTFICKDFFREAAERSFYSVCAPQQKQVAPAYMNTSKNAHRQANSPVRRTVFPGVSSRVLNALQAKRRIEAFRLWHVWCLHNPWSLASMIVDSWEILNLSQSDQLLDAVADVIGPDIILFNSQLVSVGADVSTDWRNDISQFPVEPVSGAVARLPLGEVSGISFRNRSGRRVEALADQFIVHNAGVDYRYTSSNNNGIFHEIVFRYFPATSRYIRDPAHRHHRWLAAAQPLINHPRVPLWLARGDDHANNDFVTGFQTKAAYWTVA